jgi:acetylcholinesterase
MLALSFVLANVLAVYGLPTTNNVATTSPPVVNLGYATYQGTRLAAGVDQYLGMRFAAPPLGDLRFRGPADPVPVSGVQDASEVNNTTSSFQESLPAN